LRKSTAFKESEGILVIFNGRNNKSLENARERVTVFFKKDKSSFFFSGFAKWSDLESYVMNWITNTEKTGFMCPQKVEFMKAEINVCT
jgi:hypothetical protein